MEIVSRCRLQTASLLWYPRAGAAALTILCKATFALQPGESRLADVQDPLWTLDAADDTGSSLITASDMCPFKRRADVFFYGHAYAPSGHPSPSLVARLIVGPIDKSIEVRVDRGSHPQRRCLVAAFRPIPPSSPSRKGQLGQHASTWDPQRWNARPLPDDFDGAFFNAAPVDQQLPELTGDEVIVIEHLSPLHPRLMTRLSKLVPRATVRRPKKSEEPVRLRCDTLSIDGDRGVASLVFRGLVLLSHPDEPGIVFVSVEGAEAASASPKIGPDKLAGTMIIDPSPLAGGAKPALPFIDGAPGVVIEREPPARHEEPDPLAQTGTFSLPAAPGRGDLPFRSPSPERLNMLVTPPAPPRAPAVRELEPELRPVAPEATVERRAPIHIPEPPMIGPVPVPGGPAPSEAAAGELPAAAAETVAAAAADAADDREAAPPQPSPIELSIEQVASIAAEIAERRRDPPAVLEARGVHPRGWIENQQRWTAAIEQQTSRGSHALRAAYDAAYVEQVEKLRGPITPDEYARILLALDCGGADEALDALEIQRPALMPIVRLWTRRLAKEAALADAVADALRAARSA
jgi:hypothetical protein